MPPLQLVWSSCRPQIFFSTSSAPGGNTHTRSQEPQRTYNTFREDRAEPVDSNSSKTWSFSRPTPTSSQTSVFTKAAITSSSQGWPEASTKQDIRTEAPWWACVATEGCCQTEWGWRTNRLHLLASVCPCLLTRSSSTVRVSVCPGPARCVSASLWPWIDGKPPLWGRRGGWRKSTRPLRLLRGARSWIPTRGFLRWRSCAVPSSTSRDSRRWSALSTSRSTSRETCITEPRLLKGWVKLGESGAGVQWALHMTYMLSNRTVLFNSSRSMKSALH